MKKCMLFFWAIVIVASAGSLARWKLNQPQQEIKDQTVWMTIFVHGSFGSLLGLLSLPSVLQDQVSNSLYRQITKKMRDDHTFFAKQPILERGLRKIEPSFDPTITNHKKLAAYPIIKAYDLVSHVIRPQEINLYYTFGWSGLVSQHRRRLEALRFYNSLTEELTTLRQQGINPRIRILAHSHGGNICINLAMIPLLLAGREHLSTDDFYAQHPEACESYSKMRDLVALMPTKEIANNREGQKQLDYTPLALPFQIDELILLGTPIQIENQCFISSPLFKRVYSIYSEKDIIQELDWVSTKQRMSNQRIAPSVLDYATKEAASNNAAQIVQTKIMYERPNSKPNVKKNKPNHTKRSTPPLMAKIFRPKQLQKDPDHKELWFFNWDGPTNKTHSFLTPLPSVILVPFITAAIELCPYATDLDINLIPKNLELIAELYKHKGANHEATIAMPLDVITAIKNKLDPWSPQGKGATPELSKAYSFIS